MLWLISKDNNLLHSSCLARQHEMQKIIWTCLAVTVPALLIIALGICLWVFLPGSVLPSQYSMANMSPSDLEALILGVTPIGMSKSDVENALRHKFRKNWKINDPQTIEYMQQHHFHVPVVEGDHYYSSQFACFGFPLPTVVTVDFLFDTFGTLKDVLVKVRYETL